jgi:hypothetical protein
VVASVALALAIILFVRWKIGRTAKRKINLWLRWTTNLERPVTGNFEWTSTGNLWSAAANLSWRRTANL